MEFWAAYSMTAAFTFSIYILGKFLNNPVEVDSDLTLAINFAWSVIIFMPTTSMEIRRVRDANGSIWWVVIPVVFRLIKNTVSDPIRTPISISILVISLIPLWYFTRPSVGHEPK